jgi:esterase/lipase superfamily enzyme
VWFGTNRAPLDAADHSKGFGNERDPAGTVHYGTCSVEIPHTHQFGSLGTPFWKRWLRLEFTDDHLKLRKVTPITSEAEFLTQLREELEAQAEADQVLLVYLHGFNVSFEEAALRSAQIGFDLKVPGATAFYSWPSKADVKQYPADIARVEASEVQIADFLTAMVRRSGATRVHVIAHSMGNRGFGRAVARLTAHAASTTGVRFGQILLAAPDVDVDLFRQLAAVYPKISERTTMYVSGRDRALGVSSWLQDSDRAGFTPPVTVVEDIDTVEVTDIDVTLLGHGYYAEAEPVLYDMKELIDGNTPPERRLRISARTEGSKRYWAITR